MLQATAFCLCCGLFHGNLLGMGLAVLQQLSLESWSLVVVHWVVAGLRAWKLLWCKSLKLTLLSGGLHQASSQCCESCIVAG